MFSMFFRWELMILITIPIVFVLLFLNLSFANSNDISNLWKKVTEADNNGLPQTAIKHLDEIYKLALSNKKYNEALKALVVKIVREHNVEGNKPEEKIIRLEKEIVNAPVEIKPLMNLILAQWYWHYYLQNRYRFLNRTQTTNYDEKDFKTWSIPQLFKHISTIYQNLILEADKFKQIPISEFYNVIDKGNVSEKLRPTLYDFIMHQALDFYTIGEQNTVLPEDAFVVNATSDAFSNAEKFMQYQPDTSDTSSAKLIAIKIFQDLLKFHQQTKNTEAFLDVDIRRINYINSIAVGENKSQVYIERMKELALEYKDLEPADLARYYWAREVYNQEDYVQALKIAEGISNTKTYGAALCLKLISDIKSKSISIQTEKIVPSNQEFNIKINYKNVDHVYFRVYDENWQKIYLKDDEDYDNWINSENIERKIQNKKPVLEWDNALQPTIDYKPTNVKINGAKLKPGFYLIVASAKKDFSTYDNAISYAYLWVSDITIISRSRDGYIEGLVLNTTTGKPISNANVKFYSTSEEYRKNRYIRKTEVIETTQTNENGEFSIKYKQLKNYYSGYMIYATDNNGSELFDSNSMHAYFEYQQLPSKRVFLFTDRSLYRPGQIVYFKGIAISIDNLTKNYEVVPNHTIDVIFKDQNHQEISKLTLQTNEFGSFSGSFNIPKDRVTGSMFIQSNQIYGVCEIKVEEYKRPKFMVEILKPKEEFKLNDKVVVTGTAMSYKGTPIDLANVKYRVVRESKMPYWVDYFFRGYINLFKRESQQIAHGVTKTDQNGKFTIEFIAKPDEKISKNEDPTFDFVIYADVTDNLGETRSASTKITIGYKSLEGHVKVDEWQETNTPVKIDINVQTLDGVDVDSEGIVEIYSLTQPDKPVQAELNYDYFYFWFNQFIKNENKNISLAGDINTSNWRLWPISSIIEKKAYHKKVNEPLVLEFNLKPGVYKAILTTNDKFGNKILAFAPFIVIDKTNPKFNIKTPHYFVDLKQTVEVGEKYIAFWGTGYESGQALIEILVDNKIIKKYWTPINQTAHLLEFPVTEDLRGGFTVLLTYLRENRLYTETVKVNVPWTNKKYDIKFETFRSKLTPGCEETWTIKIKGPNAEFKACEMVASLYDFSLDAYYKHNWQTFANIFKNDLTNVHLRYFNAINHFNQVYYFKVEHIGIPPRDYDKFMYDIIANFYGYDYYYEDVEVSREGMGYKRFAPPGAVRSKAMFSKAELSDSESRTLMPQASNVVTEKAKDGGLGAVAESDKIDTEKLKVDEALSKITARSNLNETAFFYPHLVSEADGTVKITFKMPEALTKWRFMGFAHGKNLENGYIEDYTVTQKELMVEPNPPRFLRFDDEFEFTAKVTNVTDKKLKGNIKLDLIDPETDKSLNDKFKVNNVIQEFSLEPNRSQTIYWKISVPSDFNIIKFKVVGMSENLSDGEEGLLPILSNRMLICESLPIIIRDNTKKEIKFEKLINSKNSQSIKNYSYTVQMTSNPAWHAVLALPYLMEFPHECAEQLFNRLYANLLSKHIIDSDPKIKKVFEIWKQNNSDVLKSNLERNEHLKTILLLETPWVLQAKNETQAKNNIAIFFDDNRIKDEINRAVNKLKDMQLANGMWPWFTGGRPNEYITLYIVTGFGRLKQMEVDAPIDMAKKALYGLDLWINEIYQNILKHKLKDKNNLSPLIAFYLYGRSFYINEVSIANEAKEAFNYFVSQAEKYWLSLNERTSQAYIAIALKRLKKEETAKKIMASIKERSKCSDEEGMYWRDLEASWYWYHAPIEAQALMIEAFNEVTKDEDAVYNCQIWLLRQKQSQSWKTTKATADAIYALLCNKTNFLASTKLVDVYLDNVKITPQNAEAGTGFYEKQYFKDEIKPEFGNIKVEKHDKGISFGLVNWQYFEDISKITPHTKTPLKLKKLIFKVLDTKSGPVMEPITNNELNVGDLIRIRIELNVEQHMEFVHMKDYRGSGLEPVNVLSKYKFQDGLYYYESTKDTATHFFIDNLPKGTYVFEYDLRVTHKGKFENGMAHIECMYAPEFNSHSESVTITVK